MFRTPFRRALAVLGVTAVAAATLAGCASSEPASDYVTEGKLTIATGEPAYGPWVKDDAPESGEGFEAAVAYAVAAELGFDKDDVVWVRTTFDAAIAPGPKTYDLNLQQFSITDGRRQAVDFSSPYYETTQVVITTEASPAAGVTSLAELADYRVGAMTGTTSLATLEATVDLPGGAQVFNSNDDAKLALESGTVDAIVVDLPTAFYLTAAELTGGIIIGQLPAVEGQQGDQFGIVLPKDSPLTAEVTKAVDTLRDNGTLAGLEQTWLADAGDAPVLK